jgi:GTP-binding protein
VTQPNPVVAIVGRPNVGKSTLFNRLTRRKLAIVHDQPGVTRDRHYADTESQGRPYTLIDTGGFDPFGNDEMMQGIVQQVEIAVAEADVIICVLDATAAPTSIDSEEVALLRRSEKPVVYVANKADSERAETEAHELYRLGMEKLICISALHGRGIADLEDDLVAGLGTPAQLPTEEEYDKELVRVAVIGRPNAGKSSLINRLVGEERLLVDSRPGTTRDSIDSLVERHGKRYLFVDTAGLRRKAKVAKGKDAVEAMSVIAAVRAVDRAEVVVLMCDAHEKVAEQDAKILGLAVDRGRAVVLGLNKMDLLDRDDARKAERDTRDVLSFVSWAPAVRLSAKTGRGVDKLLATVDRARLAFDKRVTTGELNRFFEQVLARHPPPIQGGKAPRFYYITQAKARPPTFMIVTSHPDNLHFSYQRYVINAIRDQFGFEGSPIRVRYSRKDRREKKPNKRAKRKGIGAKRRE